MDQFNHLQNTPFKQIKANINLLVGSAVTAFTKPLQVIDDTPNEPYAARHVYGWAFNGPIPRISCKSICNRTTVQESNDLDDNLNSFYSKDFVDYSYERTLSYDDEKFLAKVEQSITKLPDGHYEIELPLKENYQFSNNNQQVFNEFLGTVRRLNNDIDLLKDYESFMQTMLDNKFAELIQKDEISNIRES